MGQTLPFIVLRIIVYAGIAIAFVLTTGVGVGLGWGIGAFGGPDFRAGAMAWGGIIGFAVTAGALFFVREYILYIVKAGHIAVLVELIDGRGVPQGQGQITYATEMVRSHFAETNVLFGVDLLVKGVLGGDPRHRSRASPVSCRSRASSKSSAWCGRSSASPSASWTR